jgi:hypothetical protein
LSQQQIRALVQEVIDSSGKQMSEWGEKEINTLVGKVASAGGDTGQFLSDITAENPTVRTAQQATDDIMAAAQSAYQSSKGIVVDAVEDLDAACDGGPACIP